jgi:hypothetical protein
MTRAVSEFVEKEETSAIEEIVNCELVKSQVSGPQLPILYLVICNML